MLKAWHKIDLWDALRARGWSAPVPVTTQVYAVAEAYRIRRGTEERELVFSADLGTGYSGPQSVETVGVAGSSEELWLRRRRDAKWQRELAAWVATLDAPSSARRDA